MCTAQHGNKAAARREADFGVSKNDYASIFSRNATTKRFMTKERKTS
jgi:hypothetical protein